MDLGLLTLGDHRADPASGVRTSQAERHQNILEYLDYAEPSGFDAVFVELGSELASSDATQHTIRVPVADADEVRSLVLEVLTAS